MVIERNMNQTPSLAETHKAIYSHAHTCYMHTQTQTQNSNSLLEFSLQLLVPVLSTRPAVSEHKKAQDTRTLTGIVSSLMDGCICGEEIAAWLWP